MSLSLEESNKLALKKERDQFVRDVAREILVRQCVSAQTAVDNAKALWLHLQEAEAEQ